MERNRPASTSTATASSFRTEWKQFRRALFKSKDHFNPYHWIFRLVYAMIHDCLQYLMGRTTNANGDIIPWRAMIPVFAMLLIMSISMSYFWKLRSDLILPLWCNTTSTSKTTGSESKTCYWVYVHDGIVIYLSVMILYHFVQASTRSPGVMLTSTAGTSSSSNGQRRSIDIDMERKLLQRYGNIPANPLINEDHPESISTNYHPNPYWTSCSKCQVVKTTIDTTGNGTTLSQTNTTCTGTTIVWRPPRCHHCSVCNVCVLQYDHHCIWLNNCIGYNNVRHFILLLFFVSLGCYYGIILLYRPFYQPIQNLLRQHDGFISYLQKYMTHQLPSNEATLFDFPTWSQITRLIFTNHHSDPVPVQVLIDILFPLLFGIGGIMIIFLGTHVKFICTARTTLEHRIYMEHQYQTLLSTILPRAKHRSKVHREEPLVWVNLFDQGSYYRNWVQIMGQDWIYTMFLPMHVDPPQPYIPNNISDERVSPNDERKVQ